MASAGSKSISSQLVLLGSAEGTQLKRNHDWPANRSATLWAASRKGDLAGTPPTRCATGRARRVVRLRSRLTPIGQRTGQMPKQELVAARLSPRVQQDHRAAAVCHQQRQLRRQRSSLAPYGQRRVGHDCSPPWARGKASLLSLIRRPLAPWPRCAAHGRCVPRLPPRAARRCPMPRRRARSRGPGRPLHARPRRPGSPRS